MSVREVGLFWFANYSPLQQLTKKMLRYNSIIGVGAQGPVVQSLICANPGLTL